MARTADQIVSEQLGALNLQLVIAQARYEQSEERAAELAAKVSMLEAQISNTEAGIGSPPSLVEKAVDKDT